MALQCRIARIVLVIFVICVLQLISFVKAADDCLPNVGISGDQDSVVLNIQTWQTKTSNFHTSSPEMLSSNSYTVRKSSQASAIEGAYVRFYGNQLCVAVKKMIERDPGDGGASTITSACLKECFGVGSGTRLDIYDGSGGKMTSTNPPCCLWGRRKELRFSIPAPPTTPPPAYTCTSCTGCGTKGVTERTESCSSGEKCFTLKLQRENNSEVTVVKGCSHMLRYWGKSLYCDYKCKSNAKLDDTEEYGRRYYSICASCCQGDKCNIKGGTTGAANGQAHYSIVAVVTLTSIAHALMKWL